MVHFAFLNLLWHPLGYCSGSHGQVAACRSYNLWSGILGDVTIFTGFVAVLLAFWRTHNCHVHSCPRLIWHTHPVTGHPVCKHHHPDTVYPDHVETAGSGPANPGGGPAAGHGPGGPPGGTAPT